MLKQFYFKCYFHFKNSLSKMPYSNKLSIKIIDTKGYLNDTFVLIPEHIISVITIIKLPGVYIVCLCKKLKLCPFVLARVIDSWTIWLVLWQAIYDIFPRCQNYTVTELWQVRCQSGGAATVNGQRRTITGHILSIYITL